MPTLPFPGPGFEAVIFDMDGVVTQTALVHAAAWKRLFDDYLSDRAWRTCTPFVPFDTEADYRRYVDGMPRYDGVRRFLASRDIALQEGARPRAASGTTIASPCTTSSARTTTAVAGPGSRSSAGARRGV